MAFNQAQKDALYMPSVTGADEILNDITTARDLDCGELAGKVNDASSKLLAVRAAVWDAADSLVKQRANPVYVSLAARSDKGSMDARNAMDSEMLKSIAANTPDDPAEEAIAAMLALSKSCDLAAAKLKLPTAIVGKWDLDVHARRIDLERGLRSQGCRAALDGYLALTDPESGTSVDDVVLYEDAAYPFALEIARAGTKALPQVSGPSWQIRPGDATSEITAAVQLLSLIDANRDKRVPEWLNNARTALGLLQRACAALCGQDQRFMTSGEFRRMLDSGSIISPFTLDPKWSTRWLDDKVTAVLPGYTPLGKTGKRATPAPAAKLGWK